MGNFAELNVVYERSSPTGLLRAVWLSKNFRKACRWRLNALRWLRRFSKGLGGARDGQSQTASADETKKFRYSLGNIDKET